MGEPRQNVKSSATLGEEDIGGRKPVKAFSGARVDKVKNSVEIFLINSQETGASGKEKAK